RYTSPPRASHCRRRGRRPGHARRPPQRRAHVGPAHGAKSPFRGSSSPRAVPTRLEAAFGGCRAMPPFLLPHPPESRQGRRSRMPALADAQGALLVEVLMSAFLVALIVVSALTGFTAVNHATAEERRHNQAAQLASESQEQLRSDP